MLAGRLARGGSLAEGWLEIDGDRVVAAGDGAPPRTPDECHDGIVAPSLFDLQVNGAGGHEVTGGAAALDAIDAIMLEHGVTGYLPTIVSAEDAVAARAVAELEQRVSDPSSPVAGVHLEGPFLSADHPGMHPVGRLCFPADGVPEYYSSAAVRLVTLAPELPGAFDLIAALRMRGVAVSLGHSDAPADVARRAVEAGAGLVTHVFNAMAPLHHRAPGLAGVALANRDVRVTVIADGLHVDPQVLEIVRRAAGPRVVLISDATPAAAAPPGVYEMAGVEIESDASGVVRTSSGQLAGSALTLDAAVRNWATMTEASPAAALAAAGEVPAAALGIRADLQPGSPADVVLLDDTGAVLRVMRRGRWAG
jgi:N-acetylglucosamine-6-phosphate deacetylase